MFTGIVEEVGQVADAARHRLCIAGGAVMDALAVSDSIAVNGACLTVVERTDADLVVDLSDETIERTNLGSLVQGSLVNLERALTPSSRMGGHIVQGHVDGTGEIVAFEGPPESRALRVGVPPELARYVVQKGFIAVDGISLTVASQGGGVFSVAVIPYTEQHTALRGKQQGDRVNIEVDILAKYVERLASAGAFGGR